MKKYIFLSMFIAVSMSFSSLYGQVKSNHQVDGAIPFSSAFFDASANFNSEFMGAENEGKGLVFPTVDLVNFEFILEIEGVPITAAAGSPFPTFFDGMIVYNRARGYIYDDNDEPIKFVEPGFYFFYNPGGIEAYMNYGTPEAAVAAGQWRRIGDGGANNVGGQAWFIGGNVKTNAAVPQKLGVSSTTTDGEAPPIVVYAGVDGDSRAIMRIGR